MSYTDSGPLPQWTRRGDAYETTHDGVTWRLSCESSAEPVGWYLTRVGTDRTQLVLEGRGNLYLAIDLAGLRVAADAVRADPAGARRQLDL